jgi:small subunit ribosomal protein S21
MVRRPPAGRAQFACRARPIAILWLSGRWRADAIPSSVPVAAKDQVCMIRVKARSNESVEQMVRRFKKLCEKEGLTRDIKRNSYYEKPSERKRRKVRKSMKRIARDFA